MAVRVSKDLADQIEASQKAAGEANRGKAVRRLIERGLNNPYLSEREADRLDQLLWETRQIGNNLNQIAKRINTHGNLKDFQLEDLSALAGKLGQASQVIRNLLDNAE